MKLFYFRPEDTVLEQPAFLHNEVPYNLLHRISKSPDATRVCSSDGQLIYAQTPNHPGWLWISSTISVNQKVEAVQALIKMLGSLTVVGVSGEPKLARLFADQYCPLHEMTYSTRMEMESYACPALIPVKNILGTPHLASTENVEIVAYFLSRISLEIYGKSVEPESRIEVAANLINTGGVYLWKQGNKYVSMANISHRSPRHGSINAVYTPLDARGKGYASALVSYISQILIDEGYIPILYTDLSNPISNKIYQRLGYTDRGKIHQIVFRGTKS
ncbi:GNAT superfamily N-acetyltransferase [Paenibacillus shirakamiensis]|uniref:GNAT superfamily N-acetyltransferase n=1 Tax=Paenibacillus shirakamiensis TaxID=1265935 RepID=A0ABS4JFY2_9BACL|nr:GNAT family N-acetyltransferase [Paenibacillus shirakamiensis]MBP2000614.1 GNAT superfamily N-acetyltransferase [Paenibacillus shirakamiensis]